MNALISAILEGIQVEHKFKVSIIIPVYNVERYLRTCLDSVVNQTLDGIEIIAVNDGSTDNSLAILEEYQSKYSDRMKVFTTENHGVSHARNYGLARASGEYIQFVDSDDFIEPQMTEKLYSKAKRDNNDIVICGRYNVYEREHINELNKEAAKLIYLNRNFILQENKYEFAQILPFPWDKIFRRSLLEGIEFPEKMRFEDLVFVYKVCCRAKSIGIIDEPLYNYRRTTQGGFLQSFSEQTLDIVKAFRLVIDYMKQNGYLDIYHDEIEYICARHFIYRYPALFKGSNKGKLDIKKRIINQTQDFLDTEFPNWRNNHYLKYSSGSVRKKLRLYTNRRKMLMLTLLREITPEFAMRKFKSGRDSLAKWKGRFKKFVKSGNKLSLIKKRLPMLSVLAQGGSVYYTRMHERLSIRPKDILFESKHGEDVAGNVFAMLRELMQEQYSEFNIYLAMERQYMEQYRRLLVKYGIDRLTMIDISSRAYAKALASCKYLVTDTSFPTYFIKKEGQVYLNTWHGTPLKAMGRIVPQREYALGNVQRNFLIADYLIYQNDFAKDAFMTDYMIKDIYRGTAMVCGYPRNSIFFDRKRYFQIRKELKLEDKQLLAYMPTWRGLLHKKETAKQLELLGGYFAQIDGRLTDDQILFVKLHPYVKDQVDYSAYKHIRPFPAEYESYDFLTATDALITDYSSIMFDYGVSGKKIILFTYDREEYNNGRGLYFELESLGLPIADTVDELIAEINRVGVLGDEVVKAPHELAAANYPQFYQRFCSYDSADTVKRVVETLLYGNALTGERAAAKAAQEADAEVAREADIKAARKIELTAAGGTGAAPVMSDKSGISCKKTVLIFIKGLNDDHYSKNLIASINEIPADKYDVYVCFKANSAKKHSYLLSEFRREVKYFPITENVNLSRADYFISRLYTHFGIRPGAKRLRKICLRELRKHFDGVKFDYAIHHSGSDALIGQVCSLAGKTSIYNFKHFNYKKYREEGVYRRQVRKFLRLFPAFTAVIATKEYNQLRKRADNIIYNEDRVFPVTKILSEVTQHEGRSNNLSQRK